MISDAKIKEWVDIFVDHVHTISPQVHKQQQEGYKFESVNHFQNHFDLGATDIKAMLERAVQNNNLFAGGFYFPRQMLLRFAEEYPQETRTILEHFFDESHPVSDRLQKAEDALNELNEKRNAARGEDGHSFMALRSLSVLMAHRYPNDCNPIKPREWRVFCKYINNEFSMPNGMSSAEQYTLFSEHVDRMREYIQSRDDVRTIHETLTDGLTFKDEQYRWMAQDIIYVTARIVAEKRGAELEKGGELDEAEERELKQELASPYIGDGFEVPVEKYLEHIMCENLQDIDLGEPLSVFVDNDGNDGRQYVTDIGTLDILAQDRNGNFVVIELKKDKGRSTVIGQILAYIGWVKENLATNGQTVRGIVVVSSAHPALLAAQREVADRVTIKYYRVSLSFSDTDPGQ